MLMLYLILVLNSSLLGLCFYYIVKRKKTMNYCHSVDELYNNFLTYKEKYNYLKLSKSNSHEKILVLSTNKLKKIFCEKFIYKKIDYLLTLSKFIDMKINNNKQTFRAKNGKILIEEIASVVAYSVLLSNECKLFDLYKRLYRQYNLKVKENKIFKILLGQKLLYLLFELESEIIDISRIINKSKKTRKVKKYKKKIYFVAELYAIKKFHQNSTKLLAKYKYDYKKIAGFLMLELTETAKKQQIIITYLIAMFS